MSQFDFSVVEEAKSSAKADMDPRLQILIAQMRSGITKTASASTAENEVAVIARVTDAGSWLGLSEVRDATLIGATDGGDSIVTGKIPVMRIEKVRNLSYVESLKAAQSLQPMLAVATEETETQPAQLPSGNNVSGGDGVVVGVIDYGGDFVHKNFRKGNGKTRLLSIWDQNGGNSPASPFGYGVEHSAASTERCSRRPSREKLKRSSSEPMCRRRWRSDHDRKEGFQTPQAEAVMIWYVAVSINVLSTSLAIGNHCRRD